MRMELIQTKKLSHKEWRKIAKKERRRRMRRETARKRDEDVDRLKVLLENTADYILRQEEEKLQERQNEEQEKRYHDEQEELWLETEEKNQREWKVLQEKKAKARLIQAQQDELVRKEFEEKQKLISKQKEEERQRREAELQKAAALRKEIDDYIDDGAKTPNILRTIKESQPGKESCPFFFKTGACRYGNTCSRNHCKYSLSSVIVIPGFYTHFSMEKALLEYDTDIALEFEKAETQVYFEEFFNDVVPELEKFGKIRTIQCCCNTETHLRGNLYVQYYSERDAARAQRNLSGRWYAGRQINCEFVYIKTWNFAVCGMRHCPKGKLCNYIHPFNNPKNKYPVCSPKRPNIVERHEPTISEDKGKEKRTWDDWVNGELKKDRNWRWSESPQDREVRPKSSRSKRDRHSEDSRSRDRSHHKKRHKER